MSSANSDQLQQRILEMVFRNEQFEAGVAETMQSLEQLSRTTSETVKTINSSVVTGLSNALSKADVAGFTKALNGIDLSGITSGIESLNQKFSVFGTAARTVIQDVTHWVEHLAKTMLNVATSGPKEGWERYDRYSNTVKTLVNSAKDAAGAAVSLETVNKVLGDLNDYADKTIYSFADMTNNITKFTNAGVDLESAATAMKGIANLAAVSGANANEASRAMYNFGQALGSGFVRYIDWKSILNANMATLDFKQTLIDTGYELGTLEKQGDRYFSTLESGTNKQKALFNASREFDESLKDKWMTTEVLTAALAKYTDETTEFGQKAIIAARQVNTFNKMIDVIKDSLGSGWMRSYQHVFGDYEEQIELWTGIYEAINGVIELVSKFRNRVLETWKALGGRSDLIEGFANIWKVLSTVLKPVSELLNEASGLSEYIGEKLAGMSKRFKESTSGFLKFFGIVEDTTKPAAEAVEAVGDAVEDTVDKIEDLTEIAKLVIRGDYGNGKARREALEAEGKSYERIQNKVNELLGCSFRYEVQEENVAKATEKATEETEEQTKAVFTLSEYMTKVSHNLWTFSRLFLSMKKLVVQAGDSLLKYLIEPIAKEIPAALLKATSVLASASTFVRNILNHIRRFNWIPKLFKTFSESLFDVKNLIVGLVTPVANFIGEILKLNEVSKVGSSILGFFDKLIDFVSVVPSTIKSAISQVSSTLAGLSGFQALGKRISDAGTAIYNGVVGSFKRVFEFFSNIIENNPISMFFDWFTGAFSKDVEKGTFLGTLFGEEGFLNKAALSIDGFISTIERGAKPILDFIEKLFKPKTDADHTTLGVMASGFKLLEKIKIPKAIKDFLSLSWDEKIKTVLDGFFKFLSIGLKGFIDMIKDLAPETLIFQRLVSIFENVKSVLGFGFTKAVEKAKQLIDNFLENKVFVNPKFLYVFGKGGLIEQGISIVTGFIDKIKSIPQAIKDMDLFGKAMEKITGSEVYKKGQSIVAFFKDLFYTVTHLGETEPVRNFINTITSFLDMLKQRGLAIIDKAKEYIEKLKSLPETIRNLKLFDRIARKISGNPLFKRIQNDGKKVVTFFKDLYLKVKDFVTSDVVKKFGEALIGAFVFLGEGIVSVSSKIIEFFTWLSALLEKLSNYHIFEKVASAFQKIYSVGGAVVGFLVGLFEKLSHLGELEGVQKLVKTLTEFFVFVKDTAIQVLKELLEQLDRVFGTNLVDDQGFINFFGEGGIIDTAAKVISAFIQEVEKLPGVLKKIGNFFVGTGDGTLYSGIMSKFPAFEKFFGKIQNFFGGIGKAIDESIPDFGISDIAASGKASAFDAFSGLLNRTSSFPDFISMLHQAKAGLDDMGESADTTASSVQNFTYDGEDFVNFLKQFYPIAEEHIVPTLKEWGARAAELGANDWLQLFGKMAVVRVLFKFGDGVKNIAKGLGFWSVGMKEVKTGLGSFKKMMEGFEKTPEKLNRMFDSIGKLPDAITDAKKLKPIFKEWRKKSFTSALRDFAIAIALVAGSIWLLGSDFIDYDKIRDNMDLLVGFAAVIGVFFAVAAAMPAEKLTGLGIAFAGLGAGLLMLTGALYLFGRMDVKVLFQGGIAVVALMAAMGTAARIASGSGKMAVFGFLAMAIAINILVPAVKALGSMDLHQLIQGGIAVVAFMTFMATAALIAGFAGKQAVFSFLAIALAIDLLVPAVFLLGKMPTETLVKGGAAVVIFMTFMALAVRIASQNSALASVSFVGMVLAVGLLIPLMLAISFIPAARVIGGGLAIVALMLSLAYAVKVATSGTSKEAIAAVIAMSLLVFLLGTIIGELARYNLGNVLGAAVSIGLVLLALGYSFGSLAKLDMTKMLGALIAMSSMVIVIGFVLDFLSGIPDTGKLLVIAASLSLILLTLAGVLRITSRLNPEMAWNAGLAIDAIALLVGGLIGLLGLINELTNGGGETLLNSFGRMIHAFIEGFKGNTLDDSKSVKESAAELDDAGGSLTSFADKIAGFIDMLTNVDEGKASAAKNLADAILTLTKAEILTGLGNLLKITGDIGEFGSVLESYVTSLFSFVDVVNANESVADNDKLAAVEELTETWMSIAKQIEPNKGIIPTVAGIRSIEEFGNQMRGFIIGFEAFNRIVANIRNFASTDKYKKIAEVTGYMMDVTKKLEPNSGAIPTVAGIKDIGKFGKNLGDFGTGFNDFNNAVKDITEVVDPSIVRDISEATEPLIELSKMLKREGSVISWIIGKIQSLGDFGKSLDGFAEGIIDFYNKVKGANVSSSYLHSLTASLKAIGELDHVYVTGLDNFTDSLNKLATAIIRLTGEGSMPNASNLETMVAALNNLKAFAASLVENDLTKLTTFADAMSGLAKTSIKNFCDEFSANEVNAYETVATFLGNVAAALMPGEGDADLFSFYGNLNANNFIAAFVATEPMASASLRQNYILKLLAVIQASWILFFIHGGTTAQRFANGLVSQNTYVIAKASELAKTASDTVGSESVKSDFETAGKNAVQGFINGLSNSKLMDNVRATAAALARAAKEAAEAALGEKSPSKVFKKIGEYASIGMALGIEDKAADVETATQNMANGSLTAAMAGVHDLARMISEDLDAEPTIRPVIDTSGVQYGIGLTNGLLSDFASSPAVQAALGISSIQNADAMQVQLKKQMDYTEDIKSLVANTRKIIDAARQNRNVSIDGDYLYGYVNTRMGMA